MFYIWLQLAGQPKKKESESCPPKQANEMRRVGWTFSKKDFYAKATVGRQYKKLTSMYYVYILQSKKFPDQNYIGQTDNVDQRLYVHNTGGSPHTAKYKPWKLVSSISFETKEKAIEFERYLKSGSGRALVKKRFL